jgi:DNA-directed RNA polymerase specialized sigma24 family protein
MASSQSISHWVARLKAGDPEAAEAIWRRYCEQLVRLGQRKLCGSRRRVADEEDVALSAFDSFCRGAAQGRFPALDDRNDLWRLLVTITARKASDLIQRERRNKRGGGRVRGESALLKPGEDSDSAAAGLDQIAGTEPSPEFAAQFGEECRRLLERLADPQLRAVALWKMESYTNAEIAERLQCAVTTVERKLRVIRSLWSEGQSSV